MATRRHGRRTRSLFERWARSQDVERPFEALVRMDADSREAIAEELAIDLEASWDDAVSNCNYDLGIDVRPRKTQRTRVQAQAAMIIGNDGCGIQARSHGTFRKLNPFASNHTWNEVLVAVVDGLDLPVDSSSVVDLESAIYEWMADQAVAALPSDERRELEVFLQDQPEVAETLRRAGFGPSGMKLGAKGIFTMAARGGFGTYITAVKAAAFLNRSIGTKLAMRGVTAGLKTALKGLNAVMWLWLVKDVLDLLFGASPGRLVGAICQIHQFELLDGMEGGESVAA